MTALQDITELLIDDRGVASTKADINVTID